MKKETLIESIISAYINKDLYTSSEKTRKQRQCPYRLMNLLFSDDFADDFATVGNAATKSELDAGVAGNNRGLWLKIQGAYIKIRLT